MPKYFQENLENTFQCKDLSRLDSPNVGSNTERLDWLEGLELGHSSADYRALKYTPTTQQGYCTLIPYYKTHNKKKQKGARDEIPRRPSPKFDTRKRNNRKLLLLFDRQMCVFMERYFYFLGVPLDIRVCAAISCR